jgi:26S proteasome regulatory subunit N8
MDAEASHSREPPVRVAVHPIVLLSIADHHNRVVQSVQNKRVMGILLGDEFRGQVNVVQSFAVPFEEEPSDPKIFFVDTNFIDDMYELHRKVTLKERIVGWYSSKSTVSPNDLDIHHQMRRYTPNPIFITTDVGARDPHEIPVSAFIGAEIVRPDGQPIVTSFQNVPTVVDFLEVEEIGVEHLLRDIKDVDVSAIGTTLTNSVHGLAALEARLTSISAYLGDVIEKRLPVDPEIIGITQSIFNLLPNLALPDTEQSIMTESDHSAFLIFIGQLCRSVVAVHELVNHRHPPLGAAAAVKKEAEEERVEEPRED